MPAKKQRIAEFYAQGKTMTELAEKYGVGVGTIHRTLRPFEASANV
jgi:transposase-like protein